MRRHRIRDLKAKYRIIMGSSGPRIELLSSNKKKVYGIVNLYSCRTVESARRAAREMYPDAKDVTP
jgi:hypothetical protein